MGRFSNQYNNASNSLSLGEWSIKSLSEICDIYVAKDLDEGRFSKTKNDIYKYPVFSNTVDNSGLYGYYDYVEFSGESLTIVGRGAGLGTAFIRTDCYNAIGRLLILFPKEGIVANYVKEYVNNKLNIHQESGGIPQLTRDQIGKYKIKIPSFLEQQRISDILYTWDTAITQTQQLITQLQQRNKGLMQELLTGKRRLKGFSDNWEQVSFEEVFEFIRSYSISRDGLSYEEAMEPYCIHYGDIHSSYNNYHLDFSKEGRIPKALNNLSVVSETDFLKDGDIIIADASEDYEGVGQAVEVRSINGKKAVGGLHTIVVRSKGKKLVNGFKGFLLNSEAVRNELRKLATGTSVYSVTKTSLKKLVLNFPKPVEQKEINSFLAAAFAEQETQEIKLRLIQEQKKGLLQKLLTGKVRVNKENHTS